MKKLIILICLLCAALIFPGFIFVLSGPPSGGGSSYVITETWDGATEDNTWTTLPAGWDDDWTTSPIDGAQSLYTGTTAAGEVTTTLGSSYDNFYAIIKIDVQSNASYGDGPLLRFLDSSGTLICSTKIIYNTTAPGQAYRLYIYYNGGTSNSYDASFSSNRTDVVYLKLAYNKGTGSNGYVEAWMTDDADYTSNGWTNAENISTTSSTDTAQVNKISLEKSSGSVEVIFDTLRGNDTDTVDY